MQKTILITGATDGIGLETAKMLASHGHNVLLHGRNTEKMKAVKTQLSALSSGGCVDRYIADLSSMSDLESLAKAITQKYTKLDVLINNAGVFKIPNPVTQDGLDARFVVNTIAPYVLTKKLIPTLGTSGRVINLSSAAQSPVNPEALSGRVKLYDDFDAYAQSKLAITMWSRSMADSLKDDGPVIIAVNPGSMLGTKMVTEAFGSSGKDIGIGAKILVRMALEDDFAGFSGQYFDNDSGQFTSPHPDALNLNKCNKIIHAIEAVLAKINY